MSRRNQEYEKALDQAHHGPELHGSFERTIVTLHPIRQSNCLIHLRLDHCVASVIILVRSLHIFINFFPYSLPYNHSDVPRNLHDFLTISGSSDKAMSASIHLSGRSLTLFKSHPFQTPAGSWRALNLHCPEFLGVIPEPIFRLHSILSSQ